MITVGELIKEEVFLQAVKDEILSVKKSRNLRPIPKPGFHYKRDGIDRMLEQDLLVHEILMEEIPLVFAKKSKQPAEIRKVIEYIGKKAAVMTLTALELKKQKETEQPK